MPTVKKCKQNTTRNRRKSAVLTAGKNSSTARKKVKTVKTNVFESQGNKPEPNQSKCKKVKGYYLRR